jgi:hypothetical protein
VYKSQNLLDVFTNILEVHNDEVVLQYSASQQIVQQMLLLLWLGDPITEERLHQRVVLPAIVNVFLYYLK